MTTTAAVSTVFAVVSRTTPEPTLVGRRDNETDAVELARVTHETDPAVPVMVTDGSYVIADFKNGLNHVFALGDHPELDIAR